MRSPLLRPAIIAGILLLWAPAGLFSQAVQSSAPPHTPLKAPSIPFEQYTLPNGLQVILTEDHRLPLVAINIWYHVGPLNERPGRTGFAHLFEHMMFEGSKNVGEKAHIKYLEQAGASDINGTTDFDRTNYFETLPSNELDLALWLESDRMGFLLDRLTADNLKNQRDTVRNERRQSIENQPYGIVDEAVYHELFPAGHPYHADIMGSHADVESARIKDVRDFFTQYYTPNNATLVIAGDFSKPQARQLVEKYFGPLLRRPAPPAVNVATPPITKERRLVVTDQVQLPKVILAWLTPSAFTMDDAVGDNLAHILGQGRSSRLYKALVYDKQIAQSVQCEHNSQKLTSPLICEIVARPNVKPEDLEKAAEAEIEKLRTTAPTQAEVDGARNVTETGLITGLQRVGQRANMLNEFNQYTGDPGFLPKQIAQIEAVTPDADLKFAESFLGPNQRVVVYGIPGKKEVNDVPRSPENTDADVKIEPAYPPAFYASQAWRATAPKPGPEPVFHLPEPQTFTLANGLKVYFVPQHELPVFSAFLLTRAGSVDDPANRFGAATFAAAMLSRGTTTRSALQIAAEQDELGATVGAAASREEASVNAVSLSNNATPVLALMSDVALHPAFAQGEVDRLRRQRLTSLMQMRDDPNTIAGTVARKGLYGVDTPLGHQMIGTEASLKAMSSADLAGFYNSNYKPADAALVIVGDVTSEQARQLAETSFGRWKATPSGEPMGQASFGKDTAPRILAVDMPGAPQSTLLAVTEGPARNTPDYAALETMNSGLGGLFSSRINMNLREKNGFTYGAFSEFSYARSSSVFISGADVRAETTVPALEQLSLELKRITTDPLTETELTLARESNLRILPGLFATAGDVAGQIAELWIYDLPLDYFQKLPAQFEAVTPAQVEAAAKKYIHSNQMFYVVVGDRKQFAEGVGRLNLGPIQWWNTDAMLVSVAK